MVEDWEQFFVEKSRRRRDVVERRQRAQMRGAIVVGALVFVAMIATLYLLP
jgi:hypothetical protein